MIEVCKLMRKEGHVNLTAHTVCIGAIRVKERSKWLPVNSTLTQAACFVTGDDSTVS